MKNCEKRLWKQRLFLRATWMILLFTVMIAVILSSVSCEENVSAGSHDKCSDAAMPYHFLSDEEKESWREPLIRLISNVRIPYGEHGEIMGYEPLRPNDPSIPIGYAFALLQVNGDSVPELLVDLGGGTAGNAFYLVYDIMSGECIGDLDGDHGDPTWCYYYGTGNGDLQPFADCIWRMGWAGNTTKTLRIRYDGETGEYYSSTVLRAYYEAVVDRIEIDEVSGEEIPCYTTEVDFSVDGEKATREEYIYACQSFEREWIRIPETAIRVVSIWDLRYKSETPDWIEKAEAITDALLDGEQRFLCFECE